MSPRLVEKLRWRVARAGGPSAAALAERAFSALQSGTLLDQKSGRRKQLYFLRLAGPVGSESAPPPDHLLKRNRYRGFAALRRRIFGSKARHELALAEALAARGVPTPVPLAAGEERGGLALRSDALLVALLPGVSDLRVLWREVAVPPAELRALAIALGLLSRRAFDAGVFQDDFAPNNFLVRRGNPPALWLIDFERAELRRRVTPSARRWMLSKLVREFGDAAAALRMRFLRAYAGPAARDVWREQVAFAPRLAQRDLRRLARNIRAGGRRYAEATSGGWSGWIRADAGVAPLPEASAEAASGVWWVVYRELRPDQPRTLWTLANFLYLRGFAPQPLALWRRGSEARLGWRAPPGGTRIDPTGDPLHAGAIRVLHRRLGAIGELCAISQLAVAPRPNRGLRALCLDPQSMQVRGRATSAVALAKLLSRH